MKLTLYWSYSLRSLLRGGQRSLLAIFCVAVGVMAIVALQLVGLSINQALIGNIVSANGGDIRVNADISPLRSKDLTVFDKLLQQHRLTAYATTYDTGATITLSSSDVERFDLLAVSSNYPLVGQPSFLAENRPLSQILTGNQVAVSSHVFTALAAHIGSTYRVTTLDGRQVSVTIAAQFREEGALRGSYMLISQNTLASIPSSDGTLLPAQYSAVYVTLPANQLSFVKSQLSRQLPGLRVITATDLLKQRAQQVEQIQLFLRIVGLLALFTGGIGIVNTMQVLLQRRVLEIAMLKTSGYRRSDLYGLFGLEAALLGLVGGILGSLLGIAASYIVRLVMENTFQLDLPVILSPFTIFSGLGIGLVTALIFGLLPIVQASQVRPLTVLRGLSSELDSSSRLTTLALLLLLLLLFVALAATILGDLSTALLAVFGGAVAILLLALGLSLLVLAISRLPVYERPTPRILLWILGALLGCLLSALLFLLLTWTGQKLHTFALHHNQNTLGISLLVALGGLGLVVFASSIVFLFATLFDALLMFSPRSWKTPLMLAYRNIGRQRVRSTTTLTVLFVGVFAIGLVLVLGQGIKDTIDSTLGSLFTRNVFVISTPKQQSIIDTQIAQARGVDSSKTLRNPLVPRLYPLFVAGRDITTVLHSFPAHSPLSSSDLLSSLSSLQGFALQQGPSAFPSIVLSAGRDLNSSDSGSSNVVVNTRLRLAPLHLHTGDTLIVQSADGSISRQLTIVGFYDASDPTKNQNFAAIFADEQLALQLGGSSSLEVFSLKVDPAQIPAFKQQLSRALPSALVISVVDIDALVNQVLNNLVLMLSTIASLVMLAGILLIANAVALAMLERQREIGLLKALGYTSRSVLSTVLIEHGLLGLLGSVVAMLLVAGAITALSQFVFSVPLSLGYQFFLLIILLTVLLTMFVASAISWRSVHIRPLEVLRYE
jgi:putative ABC transport system permease protein